MWDLAKDLWLLFGRLFPFPTRPGLRRVGDPGRSSPVLVTCNFELTVRKVVRTLERDGVDAWLLVAPTRGINVWCAAGGGHFTNDTVVSILRTSGIEERVDHRDLVLPQLSATGVRIRALEERTGWKARFGPADVVHLAAHLRSGKKEVEREHRRVGFGIRDRFVMGTNLAFSTALFLLLPSLVASIWVTGLWWRTIALLFALSVGGSLLVFRLPGRPGVQKGISLGLGAAAVFVAATQAAGGMGSGAVAGWAGGILLLSAYVGYELPGWSPIWRAEARELLLGVRRTHVEILPERCTGCRLCDIVCPAGVFGRDAATGRSRVVDPGACHACGACLENCPAEAIANDFRAGVCACPVCAVIEGVGALSEKAPEREEAGPVRSAGDCDSAGCGCDGSGTPGRS